MASKNDQNTFQHFSTNVKNGLKDVNHLQGQSKMTCYFNEQRVWQGFGSIF